MDTFAFFETGMSWIDLLLCDVDAGAVVVFTRQPKF
jgi:hypothetical protein